MSRKIPAVLAEDAVEARPPVSKNPPKIGFVSLGCPKNLVDSEVMMGMLAHNGAQLVQQAEDADVIVVNTCSFIERPAGIGEHDSGDGAAQGWRQSEETCCGGLSG